MTQALLLQALLATQSIAVDHALPRPLVSVNLAGYRTTWPKRAVVVGSAGAHDAQLLDASDDAVVAVVPPGASRLDPLSGETTRQIDFSHIRRPGRYRLKVGATLSAPFVISDDVLAAPLRLLLRSYYLQRCGVEVDDLETGLRHGACHRDDGVLFRAEAGTGEERGSRIWASGGWHDAGDYGKYIATATVAVARLLFVAEHAGLQLSDSTGIPESGNGVPDLIDEVRIELDWILSMQRGDGAFFRKLSGTTWPKGVPPDRDTQIRHVFGVSTPETAKAAAVLAQASRVLRRYDEDYADDCLAAARRAWSFLRKVPLQFVDWRSEDDAGSGKYLLSRIDQETSLLSDDDDRLAAAAELWLATSEEEFRSEVARRIQRDHGLFEWKDPSSLALQDLLLLNSEFAEVVKRGLLARAFRVMGDAADSAYGLANHRLVWGSNKMTAEEGITLALAYHLTGERAFLVAAIDQIDFLLGKNPFGLAFVSGVGERSVQKPCHLWGRDTGLTIPGLLVGGPNPDDPSGHSPRGRGLLSYQDHPGSYGTNEPAIDYNSALIGLIALLTGSADGR